MERINKDLKHVQKIQGDRAFYERNVESLRAQATGCHRCSKSPKCAKTTLKVLGLSPVDQIVVTETGVLLVLNISSSILTDKGIMVIQIVENGLRESSSVSVQVKSLARIHVEIESVALETSVRDSRVVVDRVGAKAACP
jgi:hypothetical protein